MMGGKALKKLANGFTRRLMFDKPKAKGPTSLDSASSSKSEVILLLSVE